MFWRELNVTGEWELRELKTYVPKDRLALDVGGNIGVYAYHLSRLAARVISFEPNPGYVERLERLKLANYSVERVALSSEAGEADLRIPTVGGGREDQGMGSLDVQAVPDAALSRTIRTPLRRLDDYGFKDVGFIKIDVEGHEEQVLRGALQTLHDNRPALLVEIEERHNPGGLERIVALVEPIGYEGFFFEEGKRRPLAEFDVAVHQTVTAALDSAGHNRRALKYINNFLFLPSAAHSPGV